jgi:SAM-dependent methyltransferase
MPTPDALDRCAAGDLSPMLALMQLCLAAADEAAVRIRLAEAVAGAEGAARERLAAVEELWRTTPAAFQLVRAVGASGVEGSSIERLADAFDAASRISPEAGVALYSLGRPDLLDAATAEVVESLRRRGLLAPGRRALDIGCGIGRFVEALAPELSHITGLDISPVMLDEARRRCARLANVSFMLGNGRDLAGLPDLSVDLVLAVDVFPYLVASGPAVTRSNLREMRRVLRPCGRLAILNYSYRGDDGADRRDVEDFAGNLGFRLHARGERSLSLWDGNFFDLERTP